MAEPIEMAPISTAPIGHDERGNPIEEVITTASRLPPIPWRAFFAGVVLGGLVFVLLDPPRRGRH